MRMPAGRAGLPPPTIMGQTNSWHSSTRPAAKARAARFAPPMVRSLVAAAPQGLDRNEQRLSEGCLSAGRGLMV